MDGLIKGSVKNEALMPMGNITIEKRSGALTDSRTELTDWSKGTETCCLCSGCWTSPKRAWWLRRSFSASTKSLPSSGASASIRASGSPMSSGRSPLGSSNSTAAPFSTNTSRISSVISIRYCVKHGFNSIFTRAIFLRCFWHLLDRPIFKWFYGNLQKISFYMQSTCTTKFGFDSSVSAKSRS